MVKTLVRDYIACVARVNGGGERGGGEKGRNACYKNQAIRITPTGFLVAHWFPCQYVYQSETSTRVYAPMTSCTN